jgi:ferredoxin-NADP reductase
LRQIVPQVAAAHVYVCGPDDWTGAARAGALAAGVRAEHLHTELFSW